MLSRRLCMSRVSQAARSLTQTSPKPRVVIVGGVAGGASAAARLHRLNHDLDVTVLERGADVSFANCGLPYYIGRDIQDQRKLELHSPASLHDASGAAIEINTEATKIDRGAKTVEMRQLASSQTRQLPYDKLILSPGAAPTWPKIPGIDGCDNVFVLRNLEDMRRIDHKIQNARHVTVVGGGFIGLELCEQFHRVGKKITLVEFAPHVMPPVDYDFSSLIERTIVEHGVEVMLRESVVGLKQTAPGKADVQMKSGKVVNTDCVVMCVGVQPESKLAKECGLELGPRGHIVVNDYMQTTDPDIYAVGDVIETRDFVFPDKRIAVPLGNVANMQARIAADHAYCGKTRPYPGSLGTAIVRAFDLTVGVTGWNARRLTAEKIPFETAVITGNDHAGYYPGAVPVHVQVHYCPKTGRLFGGQVVGSAGVDKRVDVLATAMLGGLTFEELSMVQLSYAPPFGAARDVINSAMLHARNKSEGLAKAIPTIEHAPAGAQLIDVRPAEIAQRHKIPGAINIPHLEIRQKSSKLDKNKQYVTVCPWGRTAYFAARTLTQEGFDAMSLSGGIAVHYPQHLQSNL